MLALAGGQTLIPSLNVMIQLSELWLSSPSSRTVADWPKATGRVVGVTAPEVSGLVFDSTSVPGTQVPGVTGAPLSA